MSLSFLSCQCIVSTLPQGSFTGALCLPYLRDPSLAGGQLVMNVWGCQEPVLPGP